MKGHGLQGLRDRYLRDGFVHVPAVFGGDAVRKAIETVAALPEWIRARTGNRNVQRVQPLQSCEAIEDPGWIRSFYDEPHLDMVMDELFAGSIRPTPRPSRDLQLTALLVEPFDRWWSTGLHRDYRDLVPGIDLEAWSRRCADLRLFNQINIPLLHDTSLWLVPGSHRRTDDEDQAAMVRLCYRFRSCQSHRMSDADVRRYRDELLEGLARCGAINVATAPGDLVLYRSNMLHCGVYEPAPPRLTIHDAVYSAEWHEYVREAFGRSSGAGEADR